MVSLRIFVAFVLVVMANLCMAKEFIVGDESGWTIGYDYNAWEKGKVFHVGDTLVFHYPVGAHNVFKVNATSFQNCIVPPPDQALITGNDTIVLASPGKKWYICGVGKHCEIGGQKLAITVESGAGAPQVAPSPSPRVLLIKT